MTKEIILKFLSNHKGSFFEKYGVTNLGLFGSYAKDEATDKSDIDIFAEMPAKFDLLVKLEEGLESKLQHKIDLIRLRENILRDGLYV